MPKKKRVDKRYRLVPQVDPDGRVHMIREATNEEIIRRSMDKFGYATIRVNFTVKDDNGIYRGMKGRSVTVKKLDGIRGVETLIGRVVEEMQKIARGE